MASKIFAPVLLLIVCNGAAAMLMSPLLGRRFTPFGGSPFGIRSPFAPRLGMLGGVGAGFAPGFQANSLLARNQMLGLGGSGLTNTASLQSLLGPGVGANIPTNNLNILTSMGGQSLQNIASLGTNGLTSLGNIAPIRNMGQNAASLQNLLQPSVGANSLTNLQNILTLLGGQSLQNVASLRNNGFTSIPNIGSTGNIGQNVVSLQNLLQPSVGTNSLTNLQNILVSQPGQNFQNIASIGNMGQNFASLLPPGNTFRSQNPMTLGSTSSLQGFGNSQLGSLLLNEGITNMLDRPASSVGVNQGAIGVTQNLGGLTSSNVATGMNLNTPVTLTETSSVPLTSAATGGSGAGVGNNKLGVDYPNFDLNFQASTANIVTGQPATDSYGISSITAGSSSLVGLPSHPSFAGANKVGSYVDGSLGANTAGSYVDASLGANTAGSYVDASLGANTAGSYVDSSLGANTAGSYIDASLGANTAGSYIDASLGANTAGSYVDPSLGANTAGSYVDSSLGANTAGSYIDPSMGGNTAGSYIEPSLGANTAGSYVDPSMGGNTAGSYVDSSIGVSQDPNAITLTTNIPADITSNSVSTTSFGNTAYTPSIPDITGLTTFGGNDASMTANNVGLLSPGSTATGASQATADQYFNQAAHSAGLTSLDSLGVNQGVLGPQISSGSAQGLQGADASYAMNLGGVGGSDGLQGSNMNDLMASLLSTPGQQMDLNSLLGGAGNADLSSLLSAGGNVDWSSLLGPGEGTGGSASPGGVGK